jgi:putative oxidoreductase
LPVPQFQLSIDREEIRLLSILIAFAVRCLLVALFLPFSALDKILNREAAVAQAMQVTNSRPLGLILIVGGLGIEIAMPLAILSGVADRMAAVIMAGYCIVTALLWKQFWRQPDFRLRGPGQRDLFWDFLKNLALAGGFLVLACGASAAGMQRFIADPLASSHPYADAGRIDR